MGLGFYFSSFFFLYGKWMGSDWIWRFWKMSMEGWTEDGRCTTGVYMGTKYWKHFEFRCIVSRKLNNYAWKENGFLFLGDWKFLKISMKIEHVIELHTNFRYSFRYWKRHSRCSKKLKNYVRKKNEFFLKNIERLNFE